MVDEKFELAYSGESADSDCLDIYLTRDEHTLRKNAETDWAQRFPQYVVSYWIGHSIEVSEKHYLQVPEELYEKVACCTSKQEPPKRPSPKSKAKSTWPRNVIDVSPCHY